LFGDQPTARKKRPPRNEHSVEFSLIFPGKTGAARLTVPTVTLKNH
jgi:hypothetical protein